MAPDIRAWFPRPQRLALSAAADAPCVMFHHGEEQGLLHLLRHGFRTGREESSPAPSVEDFALDIRSLSFSYGQRVILRDVTLSVRPGEICGLLGPNGSGKSTLFRCCMGFLHPEKGSVHVRGTNIAHMRPAQLARHVAALLQTHGLRIGNIDATILCQAPKLAPHIPAMRRNLADALGIAVENVSVKATTEEKLGFTGEKLGIAAHAVALLR